MTRRNVKLRVARSIPSPGPRATWTSSSSRPRRTPRVYRALAAFGAPLSELHETDLARPGLVFQLGVAPRRIDILTELTGVTFEEAWAEREHVTYGGVSAPVIGWRALIGNTLALGRPRDLEDVATLRRHHLSVPCKSRS